jgi:hypothetical protein
MSAGGGDGLFWALLLGGGALAWASLDGHVHAVPPAGGRNACEDAPGRLFIDDDVEALGRVIRSEIGTGTTEQRLHVAWAVRNLAREKKTTIAKMACQPCGRQCGKRPVSSYSAATATDRELAAVVLASPQRDDPTGGASHFINPVLQDRLAAAGTRAGYVGNTYAVVRQRWIERYGWEPYYRLGKDLELWGPRRQSTNS